MIAWTDGRWVRSFFNDGGTTVEESAETAKGKSSQSCDRGRVGGRIQCPRPSKQELWSWSQRRRYSGGRCQDANVHRGHVCCCVAAASASTGDRVGLIAQFR